MDCCYASDIKPFLSIDENTWLSIMIKNFKIMMEENPSDEQIAAWKDCYQSSSAFFQACGQYQCDIIFEYLIPREGGRRPDVIILSGGNLFVLEYKMKKGFIQADIDQVSAYARDLKHYHSASHHLNIYPILIPTKNSGKIKLFGDVSACTPDKLIEEIIPKLNKDKDTNTSLSLKNWLQGEYAPLPSLVEAAQTIYQNEDLPYIRKANSVGIPKAVQILSEYTQIAAANNKRVLALVTGVPGAGKTLLGLDFVHQTSTMSQQKSVFLSGNGPLVEVLQYALKNKTFVKPLRNFVKEYGVHKRGIPQEHIVVFDEAQRAWDQAQVYKKHQLDKSEPDLIIEIAERLPQWAVMLGLVGEGQEIHVGEEAGIEQWRHALEKSTQDWLVLCPPKLKQLFDGVCEVQCIDNLDLNISLRSHLADDVSIWVSTVLDGNIAKAKALSENIHQQGFKMYITRNLMKAKKYCVNRYKTEPLKRYGIVCSSKANLYELCKVDNRYNTTKQLKVGPWYNDSREAPLSCCQFNRVATEFACQGLELDMPVVCWGDDLLCNGVHWTKFNGSSPCKDPQQIRLNSYRVLLTRGRDGFIISIPSKEQVAEYMKYHSAAPKNLNINFNHLYEMFTQAGVIELFEK